jgi:integrase
VSLWKRGKVWWAYFYVDGIRQQFSTGTSSRRQAERIVDKLKEEANTRRHHLVQQDPHLTFKELAALFLAGGGAKRYHLERLKELLPYFADVPVLRIHKGLAAEYRQRRQFGTTVSDATVNRDLSVLRHILYWGVDESLLIANPLSRLRLVRERRINRPVVSVEEEMKLLAHASEHLQWMIVAALDTGMRRGELLHQRREHIDMARRVLFVTKSKTPEGEGREIPLTNRVFEIIRQNPKGEGIVFTYHDRPIENIGKGWTRTVKRSGLRHIRFHDLRHSFNTRLLEAGVLQEVRMALMGHSTGGKVHATYTHVELPLKRDAIAKLEAWVNRQKQQLKEEANDPA